MLVAVDLGAGGGAPSPGSRQALAQARSLASALGAEVILLHSTAVDERWDEDTGDFVAIPEGGAAAAAAAALETEAMHLRRAGVRAEIEVTEERPWLAIARRVLTRDIDLVISGKRSHALASGRPIGSVSSKLLRSCPCPVWVVKPDGHVSPRQILAASDGGPVGGRVVEHAAFVARAYAADLHVVHAIQMPLSVQLEGAEEEFAERERERVIRASAERIDAAGHAGKTEYHVAVTAPTRAILRCDERVRPDLVVLGTVARGGLAGWLLGNTAERLLDRLDAALLAVKPADFVCPLEDD